MKLELSNKDAKNLIRMIDFSESILGYMNDFIDEPQIATRSRLWSALSQVIFEKAHSEGLTDIVDKDEYGFHVNEREFDASMKLQDEFEELTLHKKLANKLAWRDFYETYSEEEVEKMNVKNGGYFGAVLHSFEEKYWNEFEQYEYTRLRISDTDKA